MKFDLSNPALYDETIVFPEEIVIKKRRINRFTELFNSKNVRSFVLMFYNGQLTPKYIKKWLLSKEHFELLAAQCSTTTVKMLTRCCAFVLKR